jgi:quercetin dioxygenase-like cupin family protein
MPRRSRIAASCHATLGMSSQGNHTTGMMTCSGESLTVIPAATQGGVMSTTEDRSGASGRVPQAPGLCRTELQQHDLGVPGRQVVQQRVDIGPEATPVKHTHLGEEIIYILEGSLEYQIEGQPKRTCNAGDALTVPAGVVHAVRNAGSGNASGLATYVVEKGKPVIALAE